MPLSSVSENGFLGDPAARRWQEYRRGEVDLRGRVGERRYGRQGRLRLRQRRHVRRPVGRVAADSAWMRRVLTVCS